MRKLGADLVPVYEEHTARIERGISIADWLEMDETEKALIIARRRVGIQMQNLQTDAEIRKAKQESRKK